MNNTVNIKNPENYLKYIEIALRLPTCDFWNLLYIQILKSYNLEIKKLNLKDMECDISIYPDGYPIAAPLPFGELNSWEKDSYIIWAKN